MTKFWVWLASQYASVTQRSEYARKYALTEFWIWIVNMQGFWVWQDSQYARVTQGSKYGTICLNICEFTTIDIYHIIHRTKPFYLVNDYLLRDFQAYSEPSQTSEMKRFGEIIIMFNYFCKKFHLKSLRGLWICTEF